MRNCTKGNQVKCDLDNKKGRSHTEWHDDIMEWHGSSLQELSKRALNRGTWEQIVQWHQTPTCVEPMVIDADILHGSFMVPAWLLHHDINYVSDLTKKQHLFSIFQLTIN